ncbi:MAG: class IV adenylate cyclase [Planctomycetota bacterium]|nr:class IV adenylate cyclase [Planctomycetota bacterium]
MQNVECKYELRDLALARGVIARLGGKHVITVQQRDTYFKVPDGRLKRRECAGEPTEWIFYHRQNRSGPRLSHFQIYGEEEALARYGVAPLPVLAVVEKTREVWMKDGVRLHIDDVPGLGQFFEIEALVTPDRHLGIARRIVDAIVAELRPVLGEPLSLGYAEMMAADR